jgi:DNA polymerase-4
MRRILHVDMDAFFAAIEERRHPELAGRPLVIGGRGDPTERGVVSTASYAARKFGIRSGLPLRTAYRLCPEAVFLPVDFAVYSEMSSRIKAVLHEFSPIVEDAGIDEAFLDVSHLAAPAEEIARAIKQRIRAATGLTCSIGVGPNKLLAKIASDMQKPDGLTVIEAADLERRVWPLPARKLLGVGPKTEAALKALGILTIGDLAAAPAALLVAHFGNARGRYLHEAAHGIDESPLVTVWEPRSISREVTFQQDTGDLALLARTLKSLARDVVAEAREQGCRARTVATKIRFAGFRTVTRQATLPRPTAALATVRRAAEACLERIAPAEKVRLIGIRLSGLERRSPRRHRRVSAPAV